MRRRWIITLIALVAAAGIFVAVKYWPRTVDDEACSRYYAKYLEQEGIQATYIQGQRLNDTLRIDLTLLQATDAANWERLQQDFNIPSADSTTNALTGEGNNSILLFLLPNDIADTATVPDIAAASRTLRCVSIFHARTMAQFNAIVDNHIDDLRTEN